MKFIQYTLSLLLITLMISCDIKTKEGAPGPAGAAGSNGTAGANGTTGLMNLTQQGDIKGTLVYADAKGNPVSYPFDYQFYTTGSYNDFNYDEANKTGYVINVMRRDTIQKENVFSFYFKGDMVPNQSGSYTFIQPSDIQIDFGLLKITNNELFVFEDLTHGDGDLDYVYASTDPEQNDGTTFAMTNYSFNVTTGQLSFDYTIVYNSNNISDDFMPDGGDHTASLSGSVNVTLKRNPYNTDYNNQPPKQQLPS